MGSGARGFNLTNSHDSHVYLIDGGDELALIDAGVGLESERIVDHIRADGFDPARVKTIVLTHGHADHAGGAAAMRRLLGAPAVAASRAIAGAIVDGDEKLLGIDVSRQAGMYPEDYRFEPSPIDIVLDEGDEIRVGRHLLRVRETPGHSDGHICLLLDGGPNRVLFAGDLIFFDGRIQLLAFPDCRLQELVASLRRLRGLGITTLLPGHGTIDLQTGQSHIERANRVLDRGRVPPSVVAE